MINKFKEITGYASIDEPQSRESTYFEKNPIIPNTNIYTMLKILSSFYMNRTAINCLDLTANYKTLFDDAITISLALKELGAKKGDIISICMPNFYQALASFLACNRIGVICTFLDSKASIEEISSFLNEFSSPIFINYDKTEEENNKLKNLSKVRHIITLNKNNLNNLDISNNYKITSNDNLIDYNSLGSISKYRNSKFEQLHLGNEDALILFTSGSTGVPKSVVLTNKNVLAAEIYSKNTSNKIEVTGTKTLTCVPFSYPYGFVTSALTTLFWGKEAILAPNISKYTVNYYYKKNPNIIFGSPALLDLTINNIESNLDLSSVTHFISGGDFLTPQHYERGINFFKEHNSNAILANGYGNAETVSVGSSSVGVPFKKGTAGKLLVGTKVIIVDPETLEEKKYEEEGLLLISGKHIFKEYYKNSELTKKSKIKIGNIEYYNTGTLAYIDKDGYITPTGRKSRFYIMSSLNKVYCDHIQNIINTFECVKSCAVVKVLDQEELYVAKVYIVLNDNYLPNEETIELINNLFYDTIIVKNGKKIQLKPYEIPTYIEFIDELPKMNGSEKIDYLSLEQDAIEKLEKSSNLKLSKK